MRSFGNAMKTYDNLTNCIRLLRKFILGQNLAPGESRVLTRILSTQDLKHAPCSSTGSKNHTLSASSARPAGVVCNNTDTYLVEKEAKEESSILNEWTNEWTNGRAWLWIPNEWTNEWTNEWMDVPNFEWMNEWMNEWACLIPNHKFWMNERTNEWMNEWTCLILNPILNEWVNEGMNERMN